MEIRLLQKHELSLTQNLAEKIWPSAYGTILSKEQLSYMLNWMYSIETLEKSFDKAKKQAPSNYKKYMFCLLNRIKVLGKFFCNSHS